MDTKPKRVYPAIAAGHNHAEAFSLMPYVCINCGFVETLYNTRDGVTPFIVNCRVCKGEARHNFKDRFDPVFQPFEGMRIFVDLTEKRAVELFKRLYDKIKAANDEHSTRLIRDFPSVDEYVKMRLSGLNTGEPDILVVADEKKSRVYYQGLVFDVCNILDRYYGLKPGEGLVPGNARRPSTEVQDKLNELVSELK
jgi:hypothetical protein